MTRWSAPRRWFLDPFVGALGPLEARAVRIYAAFTLVIAAIGLTLGLWVYPVLQGGASTSSNPTWRAAVLAAGCFFVAYVLARFGRLAAAAYTVVTAAVVCSYLAALGEPRILVFMNAGVVISTVALPLRATVVFGTLTALGPLLFSLHTPMSYGDLAYVQGPNLMFPALLWLVSWYGNELQDERQRQDRRLAELVRNSPDGIVRLDDSDTIISCNPAFEAMTGSPSHELIGSTLKSMGLDLAGETPAPPSEGGVVAVFATLSRRDGRRHRVECVVRSMEDSLFGAGVQVMVRDVEERHRARVEQERLEAQLEEARRLEALGRLAGGIAHDFNNQLSVILGHTAFLEYERRSEELDTIRQAALHSAGLVSQLLAFARKHPRLPTPLDVDEVLRELTTILRTLVREDLRLEMKMSSGDARVFADRTQLEQVIINLVGNAADSMPDGGLVEVSTHLEKEPDGEDSIVLEVLDQGIGIAEEDLDRVFEPFFTTKPEGSGTGLGLATVYGHVQQMGGDVGVVSSAGEGSRFRVRLPAMSPDEEPDEAQASSGNAPTVPWNRLGVLVVDDYAEIARLVARILGHQGCSVTVASDPFAAIDLFESQVDGIHVLITDTVMPGMNGPELADIMRARKPDLGVVLMSGYPGQADTEGRTVLSKPFGANDLLDHVRRAIGESTESV